MARPGRPGRPGRLPSRLVWCSLLSAPLDVRWCVLLDVGDDAELAFPHHRVDAGDLLAHGMQPAVALQLAGGALEAEVEQLLLGLGQLAAQLLRAGGPQLLGGQALSHQASPTSRFTILVFMGSLCIARRSASRATGSVTPASSNMTRPGFTLAIHHSGEPLPEPIRVSAGFLVSGRSGKMLIQTLPPRRMCRVIAIRAASIWRFVTYACSTAWMPYSPNATRVPPVAAPVRCGRCCLRCATLRGISIDQPSPVVSAGGSAAGAVVRSGRSAPGRPSGRSRRGRRCPWPGLSRSLRCPAARSAACAASRPARVGAASPR